MNTLVEENLSILNNTTGCTIKNSIKKFYTHFSGTPGMYNRDKKDQM